MMEWQPIETAPKDGSRFIGLTWDGIIKQGYWSGRYFWADGAMSIQEYIGWLPRSALPPASHTAPV